MNEQLEDPTIMEAPPPPQDRGAAAPRNAAPILARLLSLSPARKTKEANGCTDGTVGQFNTGAPVRADGEGGVDSFDDADSLRSESSRRSDDDSTYDVCETVDDSMYGLHTCVDSNSRVKVKAQRDGMSYDYDWILDGTDSESEGEHVLGSTPRRRPRKFGDAALDQMLGMLEIENASYTTSSSCGSFLDGDNTSPGSHAIDAEHEVDENEEVIEFADFSGFGSGNDRGEIHYGSSGDNNLVTLGGNLLDDVLYEYEKNESSMEAINIPDESDLSGEGYAHAQDGYKPPQSIACLVSDLDAELDVTIEKCLELPSVTESEGSSSNDDGCANLLSALSQEDGPLPKHEQTALTKECKQPSMLMSSILLESLPLPMPTSASDDPLSSLTRRIQNQHKEIMGGRRAGVANGVHIQDAQLQQKLADTIHSGYFDRGDDDCDCDFFDLIVMEEVMNVPWPFHEIDLAESFLGAESEPDSDASVDHLDFDTYISNRLSELDHASGEVMSCILSRVSQKEGAINKGVESIHAAELDITTALMFAKSSREFLHCAKHGYELPHSPRNGQHNAISGGIDVLEMADKKDRLQYLLDAVDRVSFIREKEARWWEDVNAKIIAAQDFQKLVEGASSLQELVRGEEILNHCKCLFAMRDRLSHLPVALLGRVEEAVADLLHRMLHVDESGVSFDEYLTEFETLLATWLSCHRLLKADLDDQATVASQTTTIGDEWSACVLQMLRFEARKAVAGAAVDSGRDERLEAHRDEGSAVPNEIEAQLSEVRFGSNESDLESLSHRLLVLRLGGGHQSSSLSTVLVHLSSRLVELMTLFNIILQWHSTIIGRTEANERALEDTTEKFGSNQTMMSSVSSEEHSVSSSGETQVDVLPQDAETPKTIPQKLEFERSCRSDSAQKAIRTSLELVRRSLWTECEAALIHVIDFYVSQGGDLGGTSFATGHLRVTYDILRQFTSFSSHFLGESGDLNGEELCSALQRELTKLYEGHLRSIHIDAMKTTGTLLRNESWQLAPMDLFESAIKADSNKENRRRSSVQNGTASIKESLIRTTYQAVADLLLSSKRNEQKAHHQFCITDRADERGYRYCRSFGELLVHETPAYYSTAPKADTKRQILGCSGISANEFASRVLALVETKASGERDLPILTCSAQSLVKWTFRLLEIGDVLPPVADKSSAAVITLFDLYILTVLRFCSGSKLNEDVLIGLGRGSAVQASSSASISLTMEADAVAPLPREREGFAQTQELIAGSRQRLETLVDLDRFQSTNDGTCPASSRSKNTVSTSAKRLEKEVAAAHSCFFVAILVDVASNIMFTRASDKPADQRPLWADLKDLEASVENCAGDVDNDYSLDVYAKAVVAAIPTLITQATRFATVNALSGKERIFQIICCGRVWESHSMQEHSNGYVEDLCERAALLWAHMSSSGNLPTPALQFTWDHLVRSAFMLLLEGFSKISACSTEGRSLMSMDLATLSHGLIPCTVQAEVEDDFPSVSPPPQACREEMMRYVDRYIKVFYFPNEDVMNWIKDNSGDYHCDHCIALVMSKAAGAKDKQLMTYGKTSVIAMYDDSIAY